jgi:hypothetical protein
VITGFNTEIIVDGRTFHLQTEDKGLGNPIVETLIYIEGGKIIASRRTNYTHLLNSKNDPSQIDEMMRKQHKEILLAIKNKTFKYVLAEDITPETVKNSPQDSTLLDSILDYLDKKG